MILISLHKGKAWSMQLLAVACLSLAAKLEETQVPLCVDLQVVQIVQSLYQYQFF